MLSALCLLAYMLMSGHILIQGCRMGMGLCKPKEDLLASLGEQEKKLYKEIKKERRMIAMSSLGLGVLAAVGVMIIMPRHGLRDSICKFLGMALIVMHISYSLMPKKYSLVEKLDTEEKRRRWVETGRMYHSLMAMGKLLGLSLFLVS